MPNNNFSNRDRKKTPAASYGQRERKGFSPAGGRKNSDNPRERNSFRPAAARKTEESPRRNGRSFPGANPERDDFRKNSGYRDFEYREEARPRRERVPAYENRPDHDAEAEKYILTGRNPIREALKNHRDLEKLMVQKGDLSGSALEIIQKAKEQKIMIQTVDKSRLDEIAPRHQGLIAFASAYQYCTVEDILDAAREKDEPPFIIILDGVTDPHNLGAIIRTAECVGAHGVIVPQHRSVGLTPAAVKSSAGAVEYVKVARVMNLNRTIEELQKANIWVYALTMNGKDFREISFEGGTALVIGAEGEGISRLTEEKCDASVSLPMKGHLDSLNASVAAGIMMYRVFTSRNK
jgi:23S rRNA (guanosine2251-2'-O)-methyltransferase